MLPLVFVLAATAGCTGGGGGGGGVSLLDDGTYAVTSAGIVSDDCGLFPLGNGYYEGVAQVELAASGSRVTITGFADELDYTASGNLLHDPSSPGAGAAEFDLNEDAVAIDTFGLLKTYDCVLELELQYDGLITGANALTLGDEYTLTAEAGAECALVAQSSGAGAYPCTSVDGAALQL